MKNVSTDEMKLAGFKYVECCWNCKNQDYHCNCTKQNWNVSSDGDGWCPAYEQDPKYKDRFKSMEVTK